MLELGYQIIAPRYVLEGKALQYFLKNERHVIFEHMQNKTRVEVHIKLGYSGIDFLNFDQINPHYILYKNTHIPTLGHEEHFVFLALHGAVQAWFCLRHLYDMVRYIELQSRLDWQKVQAIARELNLMDIINQTFCLANAVFGTQIPHEFALANTNKKLIHRLVRPAMEFIVSDFNFAQDNSVFHIMFYKYHFSYTLHLCNGFYNKVKFLSTDMIKLSKVLNAVKLPDSLFFLYYLLYPVMIIKIFIPQKYCK